jgi:hypothetical protein
MEDAKFLEQCGISVDPQLLVELGDQELRMDQRAMMEQQSPSEEVRNYARSLIRIANMFG